jgi:hypothetical protein
LHPQRERALRRPASLQHKIGTGAFRGNYAEFYNTHRPHQGLGNRTLAEAATGPPVGIEEVPIVGNKPIKCQRLLGGLLRHYYRAA